jgi:hypothetical protein
LNGCSAAATLSYVSLFGNAVGLIGGLVGSPLLPAFLCSLLSRGRCCRRRAGSRRCCRGRSGSAAAALSYVCLFRNTIGLIGRLVGPPFLLACLYSLLLRYRARRQCHKAQDRRADEKRDLPSHFVFFPSDTWKRSAGRARRKASVPCYQRAEAFGSLHAVISKIYSVQ